MPWNGIFLQWRLNHREVKESKGGLLSLIMGEQPECYHTEDVYGDGTLYFP